MWRTLGFFCLLSAALPAAPGDEAGLDFFEKRVRPILARQCYVCHSKMSQPPQSGLRVDLKETLLKGGNSGKPAVVPGKPEESLLLAAVRRTHPKLQMPPGRQLTEEQVAVLEEWIRRGAPAPEAGANAELAGPYDFEKARKHWAFQPVKRVAPPAVTDPLWSKSAIDRFIKARLDQDKLVPNKLGSKRVLLRRVTYDVTGMPPSTEEMDAFLADSTPGAWEKVVDRLLASQRYGEQWGRRWLDLARYSDTSGCNADFPVAEAWRYRNYVIESFNRNKPYDRFLTEQLAGDLMTHRDVEDRNEKVIATGYLAGSRRFGSHGTEFWLTIEDTIENVGKSMLGLSVNCARCHDHKFDPIPQTDYYALYGILSSTVYAFPGTEGRQAPKDFSALGKEEDRKKIADFYQKSFELDEQIRKLRFDTSRKVPEPERQQRLRSLQAEQRQLRERGPKVPLAYAVFDGKAANAKLMRKGEPKNLGEEVPRRFLTILGGEKLRDENASGRLELAGWIADANNPLTARVYVNRIWQHYFGRGIVATPNDFGTRGEAPSHPELLDWLAGEFVASGWDVKKLHREILLSRAYRLAGGHNAVNAEKDPNNALIWKHTRRRLAAEEIRDSLLVSADALDATPGREHPFPPEVDWKYTQHHPFVAEIEKYETDKRAVYQFQQRIRKNPFFDLFDGADPNAPTALRPVSTTAIQALYWMNSEFLHEQADRLAVRAGMAYSSEPAQIQHAYRLLFARPALPPEVLEAQAYLRQARLELKRIGVPEEKLRREGLGSLMRVLLSSDEFLYLD